MKQKTNRVDYTQIEKQVKIGAIPKNPTRRFEVGDSVAIGNLQNVTVTEVLFDGLAYVIHYDYMGESYGRPDRKVGDGVWAWTEIFAVGKRSKEAPLRVKNDIFINYYQADVSSLIHKVYYPGVDFNPEYQRDLVWTLEQKLSLIDSIFNNVDIGKFTFIKHDYGRQPFFYEILDGKQRLSTICEFYEDRFKWKGFYFSELNPIDANYFKGTPVSFAEVQDVTEKQILELFVRMNTSGTPIDKQHLDKIKQLI